MKTDDQLQQFIKAHPEDIQEKINIVNWLTHPMGFRASGRTYTLAIVFIKQAYETGQEIQLHNHDQRGFSDAQHYNKIQAMELFEQIAKVMKSLPSLEHQINPNTRRLMVRTKLNKYPITEPYPTMEFKK